jgi:hypothetical protein
VKTASTIQSMAKASLNTRIKDVAKRDTEKVAKWAREKYAWAADQMPPKSTKRAKAKERQAGRKEIRQELKNNK